MKPAGKDIEQRAEALMMRILNDDAPLCELLERALVAERRLQAEKDAKLMTGFTTDDGRDLGAVIRKGEH